MKFTRENNILISILIASRNRFENLLSTINSFSTNCKDISRIQFCIKFDSDDLESINNINKLPKNINIKTLVYDRGLGYNDLHTFYNDLSFISNGEWLWIFNDDAIMLTKDWDEILENFNPFNYNKEFKGNSSVCLINPGIPNVNGSDIFPIIRKKSVDIVGHFSLHPHNDCWIQDIYVPLGVEVDLVDIQVSHLFNEIWDKTRKEGLDVQKHSMDNFEETKAKRDLDKEILKRYL